MALYCGSDVGWNEHATASCIASSPGGLEQLCFLCRGCHSTALQQQAHQASLQPSQKEMDKKALLNISHDTHLWLYCHAWLAAAVMFVEEHSHSKRSEKKDGRGKGRGGEGDGVLKGLWKGLQGLLGCLGPGISSGIAEIGAG